MPSEKTLVEVVVTTTEGDVYQFPGVLREEAHRMFGTRPNLSSSPSFVLVNVSGACLTVPTRIIDTVHVEGEELWKRMFSNA